MESLTPDSPERLAEALRAAAEAGRGILLGGAFSKNRMGGPLPAAGVRVSTAALTRVLRYEPRDLTISVEAGLRYAELTKMLAANQQMVPLDPPFSETATVGGVVASNSSGPRRRLYGAARDLVIGMKFATLEGKLVDSGGMVVKNVAGLDMGKLMIGSFGTLAAIAVVNFKVVPMPAGARSFVLERETVAEALGARDVILRGVLQPAAVDLLNPAAAARVGLPGCVLLIEAGGNAAVLDRYGRELPRARPIDADLWRLVREFTPQFLAEHPAGAVVRVSAKLTEVQAVVEAMPGPALARAGNGVCYGYFADTAQAAAWMQEAAKRRWKAVVEFSPAERDPALELWPAAGSDFAIMEKIKHMFDPGSLLNRGRLYGRL